MDKVTVYSKYSCPYCKAAKGLLGEIGIEYQEIDVNHDRGKMEEMVARSGRKTVPQIFFGEKHIGGFDDLVAFFKAQAEARRAA